MKNHTIVLTTEQLTLLKQALGIAELQFENQYKSIINNTILVRGIDANIQREQKQIANYYSTKAHEFSNLNLDLEKLK